MISLRDLLFSALALLSRHVIIVEPFQPVSVQHSRNTHHRRQFISQNKILLLAGKQKTSEATKKRSRRPTSKRRSEVKNPDEVETWRIYGVDVDPDSLGRTPSKKEKTDIPPEKLYLTGAVLKSLLARLRIKTDGDESLPPDLIDAKVIRRSIDARRRRGSDPKYTYVVDVDIAKGKARELKFVHQSGRMERMSHAEKQINVGAKSVDGDSPKVVIVGAGPGD